MGQRQGACTYEVEVLDCIHKNSMQKNHSNRVPSKRFLEFAVKTKSWHPVARNGWIIKFSIYEEQSVLLTIISQFTGQFIIRYFGNEDDACKFINQVVSLEPDEIHSSL
jgi:hypothetical protein